MSGLTWRLEDGKDGTARFKLSGGTATEEAYALRLVVRELGNRAIVQPSGESYYNYKITLAQDATYRWLHGLLWSFLMHRHGIPVILF